MVIFVIGFSVWLWTHLEKTLITLMQPSAAQRVAVAPFSRDLLSQPLWRCI